MEEPKKVLRAEYLGSLQVGRASGMDVLNDAIDQMVSTVPIDQWRHVSVAVAPSMITIVQADVSLVIQFKLFYYDLLRGVYILVTFEKCLCNDIKCCRTNFERVSNCIW